MARVPTTAAGMRRKAADPLSTTDRIALECLRQIALEGRRVTKAEICAAVGSDNYEGGTAPGILNRLEGKGYIKTRRFQRGLQVMIVATGQWTKAPNDTSPHWRERTERVPAPTIQRIAETAKPLAQMIEAKARSLGKPVSEFLCDCVYVGFHHIMHEDGIGG